MAVTALAPGMMTVRSRQASVSVARGWLGAPVTSVSQASMAFLAGGVNVSIHMNIMFYVLLPLLNALSLLFSRNCTYIYLYVIYQFKHYFFSCIFRISK